MNTPNHLMIHPALQRPTEACCCPAYESPHRRGSGTCPMGHHPVCSECGQPTMPVWEPADFDPSEFWGMVSLIFTPAYEGSKCCGERVLGIGDEWGD